MKKLFSLLLITALLCAAALAETDVPTRTRDITVEGVTETVNETLFTSASGYTIWLMDGWSLQAATGETAVDATVTAETAATDATTAADEMAAGETATDETTAADETAAGETATDETTAADETAAGETAADDSAAATDETAADDGTWLGEESLNYAPDVYAPLDNADVSLTVQPASGLTADDADDMLAEASYTEDTEAVVGEIETFAMENGAEAKSIEVVSGGVCYRYYFISGDSFSLCVTAQCPEEAVEGYGARMAEMVASIDFAA